jgi:ribosome-binding factor A
VAPTVHFAPDLSFDKADRIEKLLHDPSVIRDLKKDAPEDNGNGA